jgi:hypothetical protein
MTPLKNKLDVFSIQWSTISEKAWIFGSFQGFALLRFSLERHVDFSAYGALVE